MSGGGSTCTQLFQHHHFNVKHTSKSPNTTYCLLACLGSSPLPVSSSPLVLPVPSLLPAPGLSSSSAHSLSLPACLPTDDCDCEGYFNGHYIGESLHASSAPDHPLALLPTDRTDRNRVHCMHPTRCSENTPCVRWVSYQLASLNSSSRCRKGQAVK